MRVSDFLGGELYVKAKQIEISIRFHLLITTIKAIYATDKHIQFFYRKFVNINSVDKFRFGLLSWRNCLKLLALKELSLAISQRTHTS